MPIFCFRIANFESQLANIRIAFEFEFVLYFAFELRISSCEHAFFRIWTVGDLNSQDEIRDSKLLPIVWKRGIRNSKFCRFFFLFCEVRMEFGLAPVDRQILLWKYLERAKIL